MTREEWVEKVQAEAITPGWDGSFEDTPARLMSPAAQLADANAFIADMIRRRVPGSMGVPVDDVDAQVAEYAARKRARRTNPGPSAVREAA